MFNKVLLARSRSWHHRVDLQMKSENSKASMRCERSRRNHQRNGSTSTIHKATSLLLVVLIFVISLRLIVDSSSSSFNNNHFSPKLFFAHAAVRRYRETVVYTNTSFNTRPQWSIYDDAPNSKGNYSKMASQADDLRVYDPVNFCIPFFQLDSVQLYISPNGFLGLSPYDRCGVFCYTSNPPFGGYGFSPQSPSTGDFPVIGLYVTDLNPRASPVGSGIFTWLGEKNYSRYSVAIGDMGTNASAQNTSIQVAIVEWFNISPYGRSDGVLRGQIELWKNGTIIFRYKEVPPSEVSYEQQTFPAGTGIVWTKSQRVVRPQKLRADDLSLTVAAIRYDPSPDPCSTYTNCTACAAGSAALTQNPTQTTQCVWCGTTAECIGIDIVDDVCSMSERNQCVLPELNLTGSDPVPQAFYATSIERSVAFESIASLADTQRILTTALPARIPLSFIFPYFYGGGTPNVTTSPAAGQSNLTNTDSGTSESTSRSSSGSSPILAVREITVGTDLTINVTGAPQRCVRQGISAYIYSTNEYFRSVGGQCRDGDYVSSIVAYGTSLSFMQPLRIYTVEFPRRPLGAPLCGDPSLLSPDGSGDCPQAFVLQVTNANIYAHVSNIRVSFQIILTADGSIRIQYEGGLINEDEYFRPYETRCSSNMPWYQYYTPYVGLFRNGNVNADSSSLTVPWTLLSANSRITAKPLTECPDCMGRGYCDRAARRCVCKINFEGPQCGQCAKGFFGPQCTPCQACANGGKCVDGLSGSGFCDCPSPFSGANCSKSCDAHQTRCEGGCGMGFCSCGVCECPTGTGYFGQKCERWADPCRKFTLNGCAACVSASLDQPTQCEWCSSTATCVASWQQMFALPINLTRPTCLSRITVDRDSMCTIPTIRLPQQSNFALITVIVIFACIALCAVVVLGAVCFCRRRSYNPLVLGAVVGVPNFTFPRREREIIGISRLPIQGKNGRPVQGIPLKQIPFNDLVKLQRKEREKRATNIGGGFHSLAQAQEEVGNSAEAAEGMSTLQRGPPNLPSPSSRYASETVDWGTQRL